VGIVTVSGFGSRLETSETDRMKPPPDPHYRHRFPAEIISHAVWLYHVFSLSLRDVELLLAERGIVVSYETVRRWCKKFGESFAKRLRRRRPRPGDKWYLDEVLAWTQQSCHQGPFEILQPSVALVTTFANCQRLP
jgi:hypothetical protein